MTKIAFLGTGIMGAGMGHNLLKAGYSVTVYNRTAAKTEALVDAGASRGVSPAETVAEADVIITIVGDDRSSREIWLGENGILAGSPKREAIAIESTTLSLGWVRELDQILTAKGMRFIDSPVTGGRNGAANGTLTLLVGTEEETLRAARPIMESYSQEIIYFGQAGTGTTYKLIVNMMVAVQAAALAEGLLLAEKSGLEMAQVVQGLTSGAVASRIVKAYADIMVKGDHDLVNFSTRWLHKDASYALDLAAELGQAMPLSAVAAQLYQMALAKGMADKNASAVIEGLRSG